MGHRSITYKGSHLWCSLPEYFKLIISIFCYLLGPTATRYCSCRVLSEIEYRRDKDYEVDDITTLPFYPDCYEPAHPLTGGWRLFYFETHRWHFERETRVNASQPFRKAYTSPMPMYLPSIGVCDEGTARRCHPDSGQEDECLDDK